MRGRKLLIRGRHCDEIELQIESYERNTLEISHLHARAHISSVLEGCVLEVFEDAPFIQTVGTISFQAEMSAHALYFLEETRVLSVISSLEISSVAFALRNIFVRSAVLQLSTIQALADSITKSNLRARSESIPSALNDLLLSFPWASTTPLSDASRQMGISTAHLDRLFQRYIGHSPRQHRRREKIRLASRMLLDSGRPIADVALDAGFSSQSHLTAAFTRDLGLSPGRYRCIFR